MLPTAHRLTSAPTFRSVIRDGRRGGSRTLVVHLTAPEAGPEADRAPARIGLVVGRAVGNSVVRHRVQRRLRHLLRDRLPLLGPGRVLVVRAHPAAAAASSGELGADLDRCLQRVMS